MSSYLLKTAFVVAIASGLSLSTVQSQTESSTLPEMEPILGIVVPNKTTLNEAITALKEKGCGYEEKTIEDQEVERGISIQEGCFNLPGSPTVNFIAAHDGQTIDGVMMLFKNGGTKQMFDQYLENLVKYYGEPTDVKRQYLWKMYFWPKMEQKCFISFIGSEETGPFLLAYNIGPAAKVAYDKWQEIIQKQK
ncbi:MAG: hypothetical protein LUC43_00310 [Burkholderiales bacterium]|nr:hypothetical protein [Burkholderiales bacterium]